MGLIEKNVIVINRIKSTLKTEHKDSQSSWTQRIYLEATIGYDGQRYTDKWLSKQVAWMWSRLGWRDSYGLKALGLSRTQTPKRRHTTSGASELSSPRSTSKTQRIRENGPTNSSHLFASVRYTNIALWFVMRCNFDVSKIWYYTRQSCPRVGLTHPRVGLVVGRAQGTIFLIRIIKLTNSGSSTWHTYSSA